MSDAMLKQDQEARSIARNEFDRPIVLRAGAGTGKTAALVARVVTWCTGPGWECSAEALGSDADDSAIAARTLSRVVAITFTEAAAAEMAERIATALDAVTRGDTADGLGQLTPECVSRARVVLGELDHIQVRTIHAWCRKLLAEHALEARLHPDFQVDADGSRRKEIVRDVVEAGLSKAFQEPEESGILALLERDIGPATLGDAVSVLVAEAVEPEALQDNPFGPEQIDKALGGLWLAIDRVSTLLGDQLDDVGAAKNGRALATVLRTLGTRVESEDRTIVSVQADLEELLPANLFKHLKSNWGTGKFGKAETEALAGVLETLPLAAEDLSLRIDGINALDEAGYGVARALLGTLVEDVERVMRKQGVVTFAALLSEASRLLKHAGVQYQVRNSMDQLLVDEFQDTDPRQCALIRSVALTGPSEERPGLFIVGDPKQSIYGWRNADLRAYQDFVSDLLAAGGTEHGLRRNFRSQAPVLEEVDRVVGPIMQPEDGVQPEYESLVAARGVPDGAPSPAIEYWVSWAWDHDNDAPVAKTSADEASRIEAATLAADLRRRHNEGVPWDEMGVLFRHISRLEFYQTALRDAGIPYEVRRDKNYYRRREVIDAAALLRCILDPMDQLGWVTLLRSPMVGLPDAAFVPLWARGFPEVASRLGWTSEALGEALEITERVEQEVRELATDVPGLDRIEGWGSLLGRVLKNVDEFRRLLETAPIDAWAQGVRTRFLPEVIGALQFQGEYRVANLERFFLGFVDKVQQTGGDFNRILRDLRDAVSQVQEAEEAKPPASGGGAVQLMTVHKSKGLAFRHTYLVNLHHEPRPRHQKNPTQAVRWMNGWKLQLVGLEPPDFDRTRARARAVNRAEQVRVLYVAMTRTRDRLVLAGRWPNAPKGSFRGRSMLDLWHLATLNGGHPSEYLSLMPVGEDTIDSDGIRWVFPDRLAGVASTGRAARPVTQERTFFPIDEKRKQDARSRQERSWAGQPSGQGHEGVSSGGTGLGRVGAMQAGTIVHEILEELSKGTGIAGRLAEVLDAPNRWPSPSMMGQSLDPDVIERVQDVLRCLAGGALLSRLENVEILGREVPLLLEGGEEGPVGAWSGSIDLLYRCPDSGHVVVADYKTDFVDGNEEAVGQRYVEQGRLYCEAVQRALVLESVPRFEVWLLQADKALTVC